MARKPKQIVTFKYYGQTGNLITEKEYRARWNEKTCSLTLMDKDDYNVTYVASTNDYLYMRSRRRPSNLPHRMPLPPLEENVSVYGTDQPSHGIHSKPREFDHLPSMANDFIELTEVLFPHELLEKLRSACSSERIKVDLANESWRRNTERSRYVGEQRQAMAEAHHEVNRLMNTVARFATDDIRKHDYMALCSTFYDKVRSFDVQQKKALLRWPEDLNLPCPGDGGDLGEIVLGSMDDEIEGEE